MARDIFHNHVREALEKDGWIITEDPFLLKTHLISYEADLGAEKLMAATRENKKILIEIKGFLRQSKTYEMHTALGQFQTYKLVMEELNIERELFLAVPLTIYYEFFQKTFIQKLVRHYQLKLMVFDPVEKIIVKWTK